MDTDEEENVLLDFVHPLILYLTPESQGLEGPIRFSGSTPDLGDFTIRVVDGICLKYHFMATNLTTNIIQALTTMLYLMGPTLMPLLNVSGKPISSGYAWLLEKFGKRGVGILPFL